MKRLACFIILLCPFFCLLACDSGNGDGGGVPIVNTRSGLVSGIMDDGVFAYLGIPFAAPPVGDLRWRLPEREAAWEGVYKADTFGSVCPQTIEGIDNIYGFTECDEDCLYLNVWTPEQAFSDPVPVMFWIPGGGYEGGGTSMPLYNGAAMAKKGVVVVTANYRLGPLGFLVTPDLYESQGQAGNYGLYDVVAALEWIRDNISAFGGDPNQVTIFGESSGACTVTMLQNASPAQGLFQRAIAMSGIGGATMKYIIGLTNSFVQAAEYGTGYQDVLRATGLLSPEGGIEEMRTIEADDLIAVATSNSLRFGPVMDGVLVAGDSRELITGPVAAPMMIGTVKDEGGLFLGLLGIETLADYETMLELFFEDQAELVRNVYPAANDEEAFWQAFRIYNLAGFFEPTRHAARGASQSQAVYRYHYQRVPPTPDGALLRCFHGSELAYVFGNLDPEEGYGPEDRQLSEEMMELWTSFAKTGRPSAPGLPEWPAYDSNTEVVYNINGPGDYSLTSGLWDESGSLEAECDFFESLVTPVEPDYPM